MLRGEHAIRLVHWAAVLALVMFVYVDGRRADALAAAPVGSGETTAARRTTPIERSFTVAGSPVRVMTWSDGDVGGRLDERYSISLDGRNWSRIRDASNRIELLCDTFDPLLRQPVTPDLPRLAAPGRDDRTDEETLCLVQFVTQPLECYREELRRLGATVRTFVPGNAHVVLMSADVRTEVEQLPFVRWVGAYRPAYRLERFLLEQTVAGRPLPPERYNIRLLESGPTARNRLADRIEMLGAGVDSRYAGPSLIQATLTADELFEVASWNDVLFVDRWGPYEADMDIVREFSGANYVETLEGYTGQGVTGSMLDFGFITTHVDFQSPPFITLTPVDVDAHGAGTSGVIFGDGTGDPQARGLIPDGQAVVADTDFALTGLPRYELMRDFVSAPYNAVFHSASVGSPRTTDYNNESYETDQYLFDFDLVHCQSQSNAGSQMSRPQAWAKNVVAVGGVRHQNTLTKADDCWNCGPAAASIGPAADGRIKPDLCFFFDNIYTVDSASNTAYRADGGGTSGATALVAGSFGVLFEMWSEGLFGNIVDTSASVFENRPHAATARALMINTAQQYGFSGLGDDLTRTHQGWGSPDLQSMHELRNKMFIVDETEVLTNLSSVSYDVTVDPGEPALRATLVYADPPGAPFAGVHRVNDLSIRLTSPGGTQYWGNNGLLTGNWSTSGGTSNTLDTVENVFIQNPAPGTWTIEIFADEVVQDGHAETPNLDVDFGLVVSGVQPVVPPLLIRLEHDLPELINPSLPYSMTIRVLAGAESIVRGSVALAYRLDSIDPFTTVPMIANGDGTFSASLPGVACGALLEYYFTVDGSGGTTITAPPNAPTSTYAAAIGYNEVQFDDDFETDKGWFIEVSAGLTAGAWERGVPSGGGLNGDPPTDADGSGSCFVTGNSGANVDDGFTWVRTPMLDFTAGDVDVEYWMWYTNHTGPAPTEDFFRVYVTNDDGATFVPVATFGPGTTEGWTQHRFTLGDYVTPTNEVRVLFEVFDINDPSVVEAGIDGIRITRVVCMDSCPGDADNDGTVSVKDLLFVLAGWGGSNPDADLAPDNGDGIVNVLDLLFVLNTWGDCP